MVYLSDKVLLLMVSDYIFCVGVHKLNNIDLKGLWNNVVTKISQWKSKWLKKMNNQKHLVFIQEEVKQEIPKGEKQRQWQSTEILQNVLLLEHCFIASYHYSGIP